MSSTSCDVSQTSKRGFSYLSSQEKIYSLESIFNVLCIQHVIYIPKAAAVFFHSFLKFHTSKKDKIVSSTYLTCLIKHCNYVFINRYTITQCTYTCYIRTIIPVVIAKFINQHAKVPEQV